LNIPSPSLHTKTAPRLNIQHRLPDHDIVVAALQHPRLLCHIPRAQIPAVELERHLSLLARLQQFLLETAQHARGTAGDVQVQLCDFGRGYGACVLERDAHFGGGLPEERVAAFGLDVRAVAGVSAACGAGCDVGSEGGCEGRVGEFGVCQAVAESVLRRDVAGEEVFVVDVDAFGERVLQEEAAGGVGRDGVEQDAVVGGFGGDGIGEAAGGGLDAVEDVDDCLAGFLAGEVPEDYGGDVGVGDEAVDGADAGVVDYDLGVGALAGDGED